MHFCLYSCETHTFFYLHSITFPFLHIYQVVAQRIVFLFLFYYYYYYFFLIIIIIVLFLLLLL